MKLHAAIAAYLTAKRASGRLYETTEALLRSFARGAGDIPLERITPGTVRAFCIGTGPPTRYHANKWSAMKCFFKYLVDCGNLSAVPLTGPAPRARSTFEPRIYSRAELRDLLESTAILSRCHLPLRPETFRVLLLLLYCTGLRPGEARRLRLCDADLDKCVLTIWDSKFFKSRLVPFGPSLGTILQTYRTTRADLPRPSGDRSAFMSYGRGGALSARTLSDAFAQLRDHAGVRNPPAARWQPRLHDFRHTFAVRRLVTWYREGVDVQARLPWLATYLGHASLSGTQAYLTMTPELLAEAARRFQRYAEPGTKGDAHCHPLT